MHTTQGRIQELEANFNFNGSKVHARGKRTPENFTLSHVHFGVFCSTVCLSARGPCAIMGRRGAIGEA